MLQIVLVAVVAVVAVVVVSGLGYLFFAKKKVSFVGKNVIITGGSTGIGKSLAVMMAKEGANITIIARNQSSLDEAFQEIKSAGVPHQKVASISCDVTNKDSVKNAIDESVRRIGEPDFLVTCAGLSTPGYFIEQSLDIFEYTMQVDYFGTLYAVKHSLPYMLRKGHGHIVMVTSTLAAVGMIGFSTYCPAKFAVRGFAETLRNEMVPHNIKISVVYPPDTQTPGFDRENLTKPVETKEICAAGKLATPDEVAKGILKGIKCGRYHIAMDLVTHLFVALSNGLTPRQYGFVEYVFIPLVAVFGYIAMKFNDSVVMKHFNLKKRGKRD